MKKLLSIVIALMFSMFAFASFVNKDKIKEPKYPGGETALLEFLEKNVEYPKEELAKGIEGVSVVRFEVDVNGNVANVAVAKSSGTKALDLAAIAVVKKLSNFKAGTKNGKPMKMSISVPIRFNVQCPDRKDEMEGHF